MPEADAAEVRSTAIEREAAASQLLAEPDTIDSALLSFARKRGMVRALLKREVEAAVSEKDLESAAVRNRIDQLRQKAGRPEGIEASHLLVKSPGSSSDDTSGGTEVAGGAESADPARLRDLAREIRAWLLRQADGDSQVTVEDLFRARRQFETSSSLVVNPHLRFTAPGAPDWQKPSGWVDVVSTFREKAGELADRGAFLEVSEPVETKFGWHLIILEETFPRKAPEPKALRRLAERQLLRQRRREVFSRRIKQWMDQTTYESYPAALRSEPAGSKR
jgi:hypothetical protein